ncbi:tetratricopeptide repeat protein [Peptoniphilus catoniae]|uniref:tetratricopeptide repeat protein n=1 Tax=Peptoniphilus catoniae TaxID=1660341 RepID=UPI0010FE85DB|nr:tetratricopeptide repeat protein [Peptoniphilus catoniae]
MVYGKSKLKNYIIIAEDFFNKEEYTEAIRFYKKALEFANEYEKENILFELADIYLIIKDYKQAECIYKNILKENKSSAGAYYGLGMINDLIGGETEFSISYYEKAIENDPNYDRAYYYLAHCFYNKGQFNKAIDLFEKTIALDELDYISYNDLGSIYEERKDYKKALYYVKKSLDINSYYFRALYNMGVIYKALGYNNKALHYYKLAKEESSFENIYLNMSAIYIEKEDYEAAINILNEGIKLNPNSVNLYYNRACSYSKLKEEANAVNDYLKALSINKDVEVWSKRDPDLKNLIIKER